MMARVSLLALWQRGGDALGAEGYGVLAPYQGRSLRERRKRLASRVLDRMLRAPWSQGVARARDGRRSLAAGRLGLGRWGGEAPEQTIATGDGDLAVPVVSPSHRQAHALA